MSLPTLPAPCEFALIEGVAMQGSEYRRLSDSFEPHTAMYSHEQMQAYGQQCRDAALEEAAMFISGGSFLHDQSPAKMWANQLVPKIRSLK